MKRLFKLHLLLFVLFIFEQSVWSQVLNDTQIIHSDHWIYDSLYKLGKETKTLGFYENTMLSVGEIKFYFENIDKDELSEAGKSIYDRIEAFLYSDSNLIPDIPFMEDDAFKLESEYKNASILS